MTEALPACGSPSVGILVLNYHQPESTLACIRRLLAREGGGARILWIENEAAAAAEPVEALLSRHGIPCRNLSRNPEALPEEGQVGLLELPENLGYTGGNNAGLAYLSHHGIPFAWVLNNDTLLLEGSSRDLVAQAHREPGTALWGTGVTDGGCTTYGGRLRPPAFHSESLSSPADLGGPSAYVSGCSMFLRVPEVLSVGGFPPGYFLYYEDAALSQALRRKGWGLGSVPGVVVAHEASLSTGVRSAVVEYYNRRNRWYFIQEFFPEHLGANRRRLLYRLQKYLFRLRFRRAWLEWAAYRDFRAGRQGRSSRLLRGAT